MSELTRGREPQRTDPPDARPTMLPPPPDVPSERPITRLAAQSEAIDALARAKSRLGDLLVVLRDQTSGAPLYSEVGAWCDGCRYAAEIVMALVEAEHAIEGG